MLEPDYGAARGDKVDVRVDLFAFPVWVFFFSVCIIYKDSFSSFVVAYYYFRFIFRFGAGRILGDRKSAQNIC